MATPLMNPAVPLTTPITGGIHPGRMVRIQGNVHPTAQRFAVNLQCGPNVNPRDDLALHLGVLIFERAVVCNSLICGQWGAEERKMHCPFSAGQGFEIVILSEHSSFKIAVNGQHFAEFHLRMPLERATYLTVDGDVQLSMVAFEGPMHGGHAHPGAPPVPGMHPSNPGHSPYGAPAGHTPYGVPHGAPAGGYVPYPVQHGAGVPYPPAHGGMPYPPAPGMHPGAQPYGGHLPGAYPTHPGGHHSPHSAPYGPAPPPPPLPPGYYPSSSGPYPPPPPGYNPGTTSSDGITGFIGKAAGALGATGILGSLAGMAAGRAMGGGLRPTYPMGGSGSGVLGAVGAALGAGGLGAILDPKKAAKQQRKAQKKALKYGLPVAGLGVGAYALHKGMKHGHHGSSSSSSSSSSEEE